MLKKKIFLIVLFITTVFVFGGEIGELSVSIIPGAVLPLGDSASYFTTGGGAGLSADLRLKSLPFFFLKLDSSYTYIPLLALDDGVNVYSATAGGGLTVDLMENLNLAAYGTGGYFYSAIGLGSEGCGGNIALKGGLTASYTLSPSFSLLVDVHYLYNSYLNEGIGLSGGVSYSFPSGRIQYSPPVRPEPLEETNKNELLLSVTPGAVVPIGPADEYVKTGGSVDITASLRFKSFPMLFPMLDTTYSYFPFSEEVEGGGGISVYAASLGGGFRFSPLEKLDFGIYGTGGYYFSIGSDDGFSVDNFIYKAGMLASYDISSSFGLLSNVYCSTDFKYILGLWFSLGASYSFPLSRKERTIKSQPLKPEPLEETVKPEVPKEPVIKRTGKGLEISLIEFNKIFPVLFKHYDDNPVGKVFIYNNESSPASNITVSLFVERYMDNPKEISVPGKVKSEEEIKVDLYALFSDSVLEITEGTKVSAKLTLEYTLKGKTKNIEYTQSMELYDRNATTWDDDRKAAAFVTAKDPAVLEFSKRVAGWTSNAGSRAVNKNLSMAIGLHETLRLYGLSYVVDPKTPFAEFSQDKLSVDFLQFPRQTLNYTAGDCDDLSILYSALLESVGIETAFITIPGHIFIAFSLDMEPDTARKNFLRPDELIYSDGKTWLPFEITMTKDNFLKAWETGAKEWRENAAKDQAKLFPMHDSWNQYKPVGLPGSSSVSIPDRLAVIDAFHSEIVRFIDREIYPKVSRLQAQIRQNNNIPKYVNRLGVLYGRYGLTDKAVIQFEKILKTTQYVPALINMGNISFLNKDIKKALTYYQKASAKDPDNPKVLLSIARCSHELENYGLVRESYDKLKTIDPELAEQFAYLALRGEEAARAAEISEVMEVVVWDED